MCWYGVLAAVWLLFQSASAAPNDPIYLLTVTSQPVGGTTETLCVNVYPQQTPVSLSVSLVYEKGSRPILKEKLIAYFYYKCVSFQVPDVVIETEASIAVQINGRGTFLNKTSKILIMPPSYLTIIEMDKPIYKPGQTIRFRIVSLDSNFLTYVQQFPTIELQDPNSNRIGQWLNKSTAGGILDLSYPMSPDVPQGTYIITAYNKKNEAITEQFEVKEYVLPKFEVTVQIPPVVTILDTEVVLKVCAKYTYGKPVIGSAKAAVCRKRFGYWWYRDELEKRQISDICQTIPMMTDRTGCASTVLNLKDYALTTFNYEDVIYVDAEVKENGTGVVMKGSGSTSITSNIVSLSFEDAATNFKPGMAYEAKIKATGPNDTPLQNKPIYLTVRYSDGKTEESTRVTDGNGIASFSLDTNPWGSEPVSLEARYQQKQNNFWEGGSVRRPYYSTASLWVQPFYSESKSFLDIKPPAEALQCDRNAVIVAQYVIQSGQLSSGQQSLQFFYMVMSKGHLAQQGRVTVAMKPGIENRGRLSFTLQQMYRLAPYAQVVVYTVLPSGEAVADSMDFPVQPCLANDVSLKFSSPVELPGSQTTMVLRAQPGSLCSLRVIDQSLLLQKPEEALDIQSVFNLLPVQKVSGYPYNIEDKEPCLDQPNEPDILVPPVRPVRPVPAVEPELLSRRLQPDLAVEPELLARPARRVSPDVAVEPELLARPVRPDLAVEPELLVRRVQPDPVVEPELLVRPVRPDLEVEPELLVPPDLPVEADLFRRVRPVMEEDVVRPRPRFNPYYNFYPSGKVNVYNVFRDIGIKILTNAKVKKPEECIRPEMYFRRVDGDLAPEVAMRQPDVESVDRLAQPAQPDVAARPRAPKNTIRKYFPETWIWDLVSLGDTGIMGIKKNVPDTITTWDARVFCTSSVGFGVAPNTNLTTFKPFFVSLTLPYSIVRGEVFTLKATVFNYLSGCVMVKVTLANSKQFSAQPCEGCVYTRCLCAEESWTFTWIVKPSVLGDVKFEVSAEAIRTSALCANKPVIVPDKGRIDTVVQTLPVVAEGTKQTTSLNELICTTGGAVDKTVSLTLPPVFVKDSVTASVSVLGDLMGRALRNLDQLLAMPHGCGEQNMLLFAPNIFILRYLESSGQLTAEIRSKANNFLVSGYQTELTYKHDDGSYSAFGKRDKSGNTWLTAFVMKSFASAKQYIFIDQQYVDQAKAWLYQQQQQNGCFASVGKLFDNRLKGGVNDDITLSAYITAALLELGTNTSDPVLAKSLVCLRGAATQLSSNYTTALLAYTFTLAGDQQMRTTLLSNLNQQAIVTGGGRSWGRQQGGTGTDSVAVETTSYVLLALLSGPELPSFNLGYSSSIVQWLAKQQNAYGGFASTQDTVVALQALAKYSAATYSPTGTITVTVSPPSGQKKLFTVNQSNRLLYQEAPLQEVPGNYSLRAEGRGCVFVQFTVNYNIPPPADFTSFTITTRTAGNCSSPNPAVELFVTVRYNGKRTETNMVIIDIKLLSGFKLDEASVKPVSDSTTAGAVKRVDVKGDNAAIYIDELKNGQDMTYRMVIIQETAVQNLRPAVVKIYDYYKPSDVAVTEYTSPCI